jgi:hypothetical protein
MEDETLYGILDHVYDAGTGSDFRQYGDMSDFIEDAKQSILTWHKAALDKAVREARIDEMTKIEKANVDNGINFYTDDLLKNNGWKTMRQYTKWRIEGLSPINQVSEATK